jgi:hypothetical protein
MCSLATLYTYDHNLQECYMRHAVLAPTPGDANNLARLVRGAGWFARVVANGRHTVVLVHAPEGVLAMAAARATFTAGERKGYSTYV